VLAAFVWALPRALAGIQAEEDACVTLTILGASGGRWSVRQEHGAWRLYEGTPNEANAEVLLDEDVAWRLFTRGLDRVSAHAVMKGDTTLGVAVLDAVAIIA
jgi:hypothetical protein